MVLLGPQEVLVLLWRCGVSKMKGSSLFPSRKPPLYTRKRTYIVPCKKEKKKKKKGKAKREVTVSGFARGPHHGTN